MAENRFKLKLSRMFRTSLASCRSKYLSDVTQNSILSPQTLHSFRTIRHDDDDEELTMINNKNNHSKTRPFAYSICRPKTKPTNADPNDVNNCIQSTMNVMLPSPRPKLSGRYNYSDRISEPVFHRRTNSSVFPLNPFYEQSKKKTKKNKNIKPNQYRKGKKTTTAIKRELFPFSSSSVDSSLGGWWFSSDDNDEEFENDERETLFSSKSLTSDSSEPRRRRRSRRSGTSSRRRRVGSEVGLVPLEGRVKDSFAVVKKSSDPHNDFRTSMVEMIVEKQIFSAKDLETLLQCFLSLNSEHHHGVIVEVFTEILEALFSNWES